MEDVEATTGRKYKRLKSRKDHGGTSSGPRLTEMHSMDDQSLLIESRGRSFGSKTRGCVRVTSQSKKSAGEIEESYRTIGKTLSNPEVRSTS